MSSYSKTLYVVEILTYIALLILTAVFLDYGKVRMHVTRSALDCAVDGDNDDTTCLADTLIERALYLKIAYFIYAGLAFSIFSAMVATFQRLSDPDAAVKHSMAYVTLDVPGEIVFCSLIFVSCGLTEIYQHVSIAFIVFTCAGATFIHDFTDMKLHSGRIFNLFVAWYIGILRFGLFTVGIISLAYFMAKSPDLPILYTTPFLVTVIYWLVTTMKHMHFYYTDIPQQFRKLTRGKIMLKNKVKERTPSTYIHFIEEYAPSFIREHTDLLVFFRLVWKSLICVLFITGTANLKINFT